MKNFWRLASIIFLGFLGAFISQSSAQATEYSIGDTGPAGGKIFITPSTSGNTTGKYFEAAPENTSASNYYWCNSSSQNIPGTFFTSIGTGATNTTAMINFGCTSGAAIQATQYTLNGFSDWYLPSLDEARQFSITKTLTGLFDGSPVLDAGNIGTWSSSGFSASESYQFLVSNGSLNARNTTMFIGRVRAIRSFTPTKTAAEIAAEEAAAAAARNAQAEADRKRGEEERDARIAAAKLVLMGLLQSGSSFTAQQMLEADAGVKRPESIIAIYKELVAIQIKNQGNSTEAEKANFRRITGLKYQTIEKVTSDNATNLYVRDLVTYGLLGSATPQKTRIMSALMALPLSSRDTMEKVNAFFAAEVKSVTDRRARLAARLARPS
jgi:hypothetical protein